MAKFVFDLGDELPDGDDYSIQFKNINYEHCHPKKKEENKVSSDYSIHFILYGRGYLISNNEPPILLKNSSAFLLFKGEKYRYAPVQSDPWSYIWISFDGNNAEKIMRKCGFTKEKPYISFDDFFRIKDVLNEFINYSGNTNCEKITNLAFFLKLISYMIDENKNASQGTSTKMRRIREVLLYTNCNYRLPLTVEEVAYSCNTSPSYMMSIFSEEMGMSFINYLSKFRISQACIIFQEKPELSIEDVAKYVGYEDSKYFARVFKKIKKMTPSEYRKSQIDEDPLLWFKEKGFEKLI